LDNLNRSVMSEWKGVVKTIKKPKRRSKSRLGSFEVRKACGAFCPQISY
jgi:hypothetical protein